MNLFRKELDLFIVHKAFVLDDYLKLIENILFDIWCIRIYKFFIDVVKIIRTASFWASVHTKIRNEIVYDVYPIFVDCLEISKYLNSLVNLTLTHSIDSIIFIKMLKSSVVLVMSSLMTAAEGRMSFGSCPEVKVMANFDKYRYVGKWYQIVRDYNLLWTPWVQCMTMEFS